VVIWPKGGFKPFSTQIMCRTPFRSACKLMAKQKVALECLSYHATASQDQTVKLASAPIRSAEEFIGKKFKAPLRFVSTTLY